MRRDSGLDGELDTLWREFNPDFRFSSALIRRRRSMRVSRSLPLASSLSLTSHLLPPSTSDLSPIPHSSSALLQYHTCFIREGDVVLSLAKFDLHTTGGTKRLQGASLSRLSLSSLRARQS
jgi:hypothetical protein